MTEIATNKDGFVHNRVVPAIWIVAVSLVIIALPWQLSLVSMVLVAVVAGVELERMVLSIRSRWKWSVHAPILAEWLLLVQWPLALTYVRYQAGAGMMALVVFTIFVCDVSAFIGGNKLGLGEHKIAPRISPGKSYEGVVLACVFGLITAFLVRWVCSVDISTAKLVPFALILVLVGVVGDFNESWIKRLADVKDSSRLLRDHGGMLDRIDSLLPASLLAAILLSQGMM